VDRCGVQGYRALMIGKRPQWCCRVTKYDRFYLFYFFIAFRRGGAVDSCHTPLLTLFGQHKEELSNKNAMSSLLLLSITDTRRMRYFVVGFPLSCEDETALKRRSWIESMRLTSSVLHPLSDSDFVLGDAGFGLTPVLVRTTTVYFTPHDMNAACAPADSIRRGLGGGSTRRRGGGGDEWPPERPRRNSTR